LEIWASNINEGLDEIDHECFGMGVSYEFSPFEFGEQVIVKYYKQELLLRTAFENDEV